MRKFFLVIICLFLSFIQTNAYNSEELITLYVEEPTTWTDIYTVPEGKDLVLNRIMSSKDTLELSLRNWTGGILAKVTWKTEYLGWELVITDNLQVLQVPDTWGEYFMLFGILVNEWADISGTSTTFNNWGGGFWNKNIFSKDDIDKIYWYEFIFFVIVWVVRFLEHILRRKLDIKLF